MMSVLKTIPGQFRTLSLTAIVAATGLSAPSALAYDMWAGSGNTCTTDRCNATVIHTSLNPSVDPVTLTKYPGETMFKLWAPAGQCLRIEVATNWGSGVDTEMNVLSPNISYRWRNDDVSGSSNPRVEIPSTPYSGYYTVVLHHWNGAAVGSYIDLAYGIYVPGNMNCANPTTLHDARAGTVKNTALRPVVSGPLE